MNVLPIYDHEREDFRLLAEGLPRCRLDQIELAAKGPGDLPLTIDLAWVGAEKPARMVIHISGTHGVEGHVGSLIQRCLLRRPLLLQEDEAILFVHGLNPWGMAWNRRVNENNVDLNRNCTEDRRPNPSYAKVHDFVNPPQSNDWFFPKLMWNVCKHGIHDLAEAIVTGQYEYPKGLFFGGTELQEEPRRFFEWIDRNLSGLDETRFMVIDVHSGLGPKGYDTLLTSGAPPDSLVKIIGDQIQDDTQKKNVDYEARGVVVDALREHLPSADVITLGEEFGTVGRFEILQALRNENAATWIRPLEWNSPERMDLFLSFFLDDIEWQWDVLERGRRLVEKVFVWSRDYEY